MSSIRISKISGDRISVASPYNDSFVKRARNLAGKFDFDSRTWVFPQEVTEDVRAALRAVYGQDDQPTETCRLRVIYDGDLDTGGHGDVVVGGRQVARAFDRDGGARLGEDVVVRRGGFTSGGSRKNWRIVIRDNTEFDLLRLPVAMAHRLEEKFPDWCRIVPADGVEPTPVTDTDSQEA